MREFLMIFAAAVLASCTTTNDDQINIQRKLSLTVPVPPISRVGIAEEGDSYLVSWVADDQIGAWATAEGISAQSCFSISEQVDAANAVFAGLISPDVNQLRFLYPFDSDLHKGSDNSIELSLAEQHVGSGLSHIGATSYMVSQEVDIDASGDMSDQNTLSLKHLGAAIELKMKFEDEYSYNESDFTITQVTLGNENVALPLTAKLDISSGVLSTVQSGVMRLVADDIEAENGVYYIRFSTFPFSLSVAQSLPLEVTLVDRAGITHHASTTIAAGGDILAATKNIFYARLSNPASESGGGAWALKPSDFGASYDDNGILVFDEVVMSCSQVALGYNSIQFKANDGRMQNLSPIPKIRKIVVTQGVADDGNALECSTLVVSMGSEPNPQGEVAVQVGTTTQGDVRLNTYTYVSSSPCSFFSIRNSVSPAFASSIVLYYEGEFAPYIFSNRASMDFKQEGETITTDLKIVNRNNDEEISVSSSNSHFKPSINGAILNIEASENQSDNVENGVVAVEIDGGNRFEIAVSQQNETLTPGAEYSIVWSDLYSENKTLDSPAILTFDDYKVSFHAGTSPTQYFAAAGGSMRLYDQGRMIIENVSGGSITSLEIECTSLSNTNFDAVNCGTMTSGSNIVKWSGSSASVAITAGGKCYMKRIKINGDN